jgi:acyl-CoA synthetase (AMP-forming)/AMP-acid ligase II
MWQDSVKNFRDKHFLFWEDQKFTYQEFDASVNQLANGLLRIGIEKGDRVCAFLNNGSEMIHAFLATAKIGAIFVPINIAFREKETMFLINNCKAKMIITENDFLEMILSVRDSCPSLLYIVGISSNPISSKVKSLKEIIQKGAMTPPPLPDLQMNDLQILLYTSGTTGNPKGVMCQQNYWHIIGRRTQPPLGYDESDRLLIYVPLFHNLGLHLLTVMIMVGGTVILVDRWHPTKFWEWVNRYHINRTFFLGFTVYTLTQNPKSGDPLTHPIKKCMAAVRGIEEETLKEFYDRFRIPLLGTYGFTEFPYVTNATGGDSIKKSNTVGTESPGVEMRLIDDDGNEVPIGEIGEILLRGKSGTLGYFNDPEATSQLIDPSGWYHTGDLAYKDEDGYYYFCDRKKDMIRRSGENISSAEIEGVLLTHPDISDAAVIGVPDKIRGQEVKAYVVPKLGVKLTPEKIWSYCETELAYFKIPRYIELRDSLPKTKTQKTQKFVLRKEKEDLTDGCFDRTPR